MLADRVHAAERRYRAGARMPITGDGRKTWFPTTP
jgi:hypothetical protein